MKVDAWGMTEIGLVRESNQDSIGCFPDLKVFIVADGMGGHADGELASRMAVAVIRERLAEGDESEAPTRVGRLQKTIRRLFNPEQTATVSSIQFDPRRLEQAVTTANQRVFEAGAQSGQKRALGTTVVVLKLTEERVYWAHVGDSRLYRLRHGQLDLLTADHTIYGEPYLDRPTIPTDLRHTNQLIQALGVRPEVSVSTRSDGVAPGDLFLLCSDGVSGLLDASVLAEQLNTNHPLEEIGRNLIRLALEAGGRDNASVVLVRVGDSR